MRKQELVAVRLKKVTYQDIVDHLDAGLLTELWPELGMRRAIRQAWEAAHPVLAAAVASGRVA